VGCAVVDIVGEPNGYELDLNTLLHAYGFAPEDVVVLRHRPKEAEVRRIFPWLIAERPELYHLYQASQAGTAGRAVRRAKVLATFVGLKPRSAVFAGLYRVRGSRPLGPEEFWALPGQTELAAYGLEGHGSDADDHILIDLEPLDTWHPWIGRLVVGWPPPERSWFRRAERNVMPVQAITEESQFADDMPAWESLVLTWDQLKIMPSSWTKRLSQWRGIYFIFDTVREKGYVGSASGAENILGRWMSYAKTGHGGNVRLRASRPTDLRFSILQRTSPDLARSDVEALEIAWKVRLHVREHGLCAN
jgi:hypothetical protein